MYVERMIRRFAVFVMLFACGNWGCSCDQPKPPAPKIVEKVPEPPPRIVPLIPKMQGINDQMEKLVAAVKSQRVDDAKQAASLIEQLAQAIHPKHDQQPGYGDQFEAITQDFKAASSAMNQATKASLEEMKKALRHLHDQCLRCHDQAPAAAGAGVCQLAD